MATITIEITAGGTTAGRTKTVSGPHLTRMLAAYRAFFENPGMTDEEVIHAWADSLLNHSKRLILRTEQSVASQAAGNSVTEITLT
jgi:hypothetical protein